MYPSDCLLVVSQSAFIGKNRKRRGGGRHEVSDHRDKDFTLCWKISAYSQSLTGLLSPPVSPSSGFSTWIQIPASPFALTLLIKRKQLPLKTPMEENAASPVHWNAMKVRRRMRQKKRNKVFFTLDYRLRSLKLNEKFKLQMQWEIRWIWMLMMKIKIWFFFWSVKATFNSNGLLCGSCYCK